jgi:putative oxidoreductase
MKKQLFHTTDNWHPLILRVLLGLVIFPHGAQKLLGWFGGYGFSGTMHWFTETMGFPWLMAFLIVMLESLGALALIAGFGSRILAAFFTLLALGIMFSSHIQNGFFMNWFGNQEGEGIEYFLLWIGISLALVISGGGKYSIDRIYLSNTQGK